MVIAEHQDLSPSMSRHIRALKMEIDQGIRRLLREGVKDGSVQPCDVKMTAFALAGALNWIAHWYRADKAMTAAQSKMNSSPSCEGRPPNCSTERALMVANSGRNCFFERSAASAS